MSASPTTNIAINGFGVIGQEVLTSIFETPDTVLRQERFQKNPELYAGLNGAERFNVLAINDLLVAKVGAAAFADNLRAKRLSGFDVEAKGRDILSINGHEIALLSEESPASLPWGQLRQDQDDKRLYILECTGHWKTLEDSPEGQRPVAYQHVDAGASGVIVSCPAKGMNTHVMGANHHDVGGSPEHAVISNASCTTNAAVVMLSAFQNCVSIGHVTAITAHASTPEKEMDNDFLYAETSAIPCIPLVMPELQGKVDGYALYGSVTDGSILTLKIMPSKPLSSSIKAEDINAAFKVAANGSLQGLLGYTSENLPASAIKGSRYSAVFMAANTKILHDGSVSVTALYDNNAGYAARMAEVTAELCGAQLARLER